MLAYTDICFNLESFESMCSDRRITLVLASKTIPKETLQRLAADYAVIYGENRVQELVDKYFEGPTWVFIGRLQRNKVKYLVDKVSMICSVDSLSLADEIESRCAKIDKNMPILIEVNCGEEAKGGVPMPEVEALLQACIAKPHLDPLGLMAVLPIVGAEEAAEKVATLYRQLADKYSLLYLSMGMSEDYRMAIEHGANMIRIGSAVFGKRS